MNQNSGVKMAWETDLEWHDPPHPPPTPPCYPGTPQLLMLKNPGFGTLEIRKCVNVARALLSLPAWRRCLNSHFYLPGISYHDITLSPIWTKWRDNNKHVICCSHQRHADVVTDARGELLHLPPHSLCEENCGTKNRKESSEPFFQPAPALLLSIRVPIVVI